MGRRNEGRFGVIVVLFNPSADVVDAVSKLTVTAPHVIVVDNSAVTDEAVQRALADAGVTVVANTNRGGLAGAYNRGVDEMLGRDVDAVFFLDQDSEVESTFFDDMLEPVEGELDEAFVIGPTIAEIRMGITMPAYPPQQDLRDRRLAHPDLVPAVFVISSGSLISRAALERLGEFREDYFIEWLDVEVCLRAQRLGIPVLMNEVVRLRQMTGDITQHGNRFTTNHPAWRKYYRVRNAVLVSREYGYGRLGGLGRVARALREVTVVARFERDRRRKITAILVGLADGLRGRSGLFEDLHPRVQRYCASAPARPQAAGR